MRNLLGLVAFLSDRRASLGPEWLLVEQSKLYGFSGENQTKTQQSSPLWIYCSKLRINEQNVLGRPICHTQEATS